MFLGFMLVIESSFNHKFDIFNKFLIFIRKQFNIFFCKVYKKKLFCAKEKKYD